MLMNGNVFSLTQVRLSGSSIFFEEISPRSEARENLWPSDGLGFSFAPLFPEPCGDKILRACF